MTTLLTMKGFNKQIDYLCFTANTANSTIKLNKVGSPTAVTLETSRDGSNWSTYTFGTTITLSNVGDKIYWRNTSETTTGFSTYYNGNYYRFIITGSVAASGDITTLINRNGAVLTLSDYCFATLFYQCSSLTHPPILPATTLGVRSYNTMFFQCTNLISLPKIPALTYSDYSCIAMFSDCSKIKLSKRQTGAYQTPYRIPTEGTGTGGSNKLDNMFLNTGGTFKGTPTINTTYYTSNTVI